ncbi:PD-(D/E)XK nuclease family protein [Bacillus sp. FJAT-27245]|uniref:PD-(D/E)XK nuclease family protein n=1 Tax=Bacillus sp. FJAT-27245 TaxID=1684144 RepID=UPI0006A78BD9|nr:PD-(D/E)XK nuclease family protein [Bacillus sp. FJAT-27245]
MYEGILKSFSSFSESLPKENENLFEICGFPHYETVISNVLAFFFDPSKPHDLKTTLIEAILQAVGQDYKSITDGWEVEREVRTSKGTFIDIVLISEEIVIIIENKIFAPLYNDLNGYLDFIKIEYPNRKIYPIVLCLTAPLSYSQVDGFSVITYEAFFKNVRALLGDIIETVNLRYFQILADLMDNVRKLKEGTKMDETFVKFIEQNNEELMRLIKDINVYRNTLRKKVKEVNSLLPETINEIKLTKWEYRDLNQLYDIAVTDLVLNGNVKIALDVIIDHNGWRIEIIQRGNGVDLKEFCSNKGIYGGMEGNKLAVHSSLPFNENPTNISEKAYELLDALTK